MTLDLTPHLRWPLAGLLLAAVLVGLLVWWGRRPPTTAADGDRLVARTDRLRPLPRYRALVRRRAWRTGLESLAAAVLLAGCVLLVARPAEVEEEAVAPSRDLVLCIDASQSMAPYAAEVMRSVRRVVGGLEGDRVGLTVFNGATVVKFPLTDDRGYVDDQLAEAQRAFTDGDVRYVRSTLEVRASQVGDALVGCVRGFDRLAEDRARAVLVVTDNQPVGPPVFTVADAAAEAEARDVVLHALLAGAGTRPEDRAFAGAVRGTGGTLSVLADGAAVASVVDRVDALEARRLAEPPRAVVRDEPALGVAVAAAGLVGLVLLMATRRR